MLVRSIPPSRWPWAVGLYGGLGVFVGSAHAELAAAAIAGGFARRPAAFDALMWVVALPAWAVLTTVWYPRRRTAALAGPMTYGGLVMGDLLRQDPKFWQWSFATLQPLLDRGVIVGSVMLSVAAVTAAWSASAWRRVGVPVDPSACPHCGYHRDELLVCPECGSGV